MKKPKRIKSKNHHLFATRIPRELFDRINTVRARQGLTWAQLLSGLFEWHIAKAELEESKK